MSDAILPRTSATTERGADAAPSIVLDGDDRLVPAYQVALVSLVMGAVGILAILLA